MENLLQCPKCNGKPKLHHVGDWKTLIIYKCKDCGFTPLKSGDARTVIFDAWKIWNKRVKEWVKENERQKETGTLD